MGTMRLNDVVTDIVGDVIAGRSINKRQAAIDRWDDIDADGQYLAGIDGVMVRIDRRARALQVKAGRSPRTASPPLPFQLPAAVAMDLEGTMLMATRVLTRAEFVRAIQIRGQQIAQRPQGASRMAEGTDRPPIASGPITRTGASASASTPSFVNRWWQHDSRGGRVMALPIILADQRLAERRGIKAAIFGKSGIGKTSLLWTLTAGHDAVLRPRGGRPRHRGLERRHDPPAHLGGMPRLRGVHRRTEPGDPRWPALQPDALQRGLRKVRRSACARQIRDGLRRLDHGRRSPLLPVGEGAARGLLGEDRQARYPRRLRPAWPRDDRLDHPSPAHARQERRSSSASSTRSSMTSIARSTCRRSTARRPASSCPASSMKS